MEVFYPQIRLVHITCVILSGSLFALRGLLRLAGSAGYRHALVRYLSYAIDTTLLTAAFMLMTVTHQYPIANSWLTVKVALIVLYIVLGMRALRDDGSRRTQAWSYAAALLVFLAVVRIARTHDPLGFLRLA
jgi:uncharacterized membrane protein SirB2